MAKDRLRLIELKAAVLFAVSFRAVVNDGMAGLPAWFFVPGLVLSVAAYAWALVREYRQDREARG
jgi:hypothetical protein